MIYWLKRIKRRWLIRCMEWREADKDYPEIGQKCLLQEFGSDEFTYTYISDAIPPFAETEQEKRSFYQFISDHHGVMVNALGMLWKPK